MRKYYRILSRIYNTSTTLYPTPRYLTIARLFLHLSICSFQLQKTKKNSCYLVTNNLVIPLSSNLGDVLEMGALLSIRVEDVEAFERYIAQLKAFYREFSTFTPESPRMFMLLGIIILILQTLTLATQVLIC